MEVSNAEQACAKKTLLFALAIHHWMCHRFTKLKCIENRARLLSGLVSLLRSSKLCCKKAKDEWNKRSSETTLTCKVWLFFFDFSSQLLLLNRECTAEWVVDVVALACPLRCLLASIDNETKQNKDHPVWIILCLVVCFGGLMSAEKTLCHQMGARAPNATYFRSDDLWKLMLVVYLSKTFDTDTRPRQD